MAIFRNNTVTWHFLKMHFCFCVVKMLRVNCNKTNNVQGLTAKEMNWYIEFLGFRRS